MKCEKMHELFSPYLDKMTNPKETEIIEAHLQECPKCQKHLHDMRVMCTLLKNLDAPQVPAGFAADLKKHLAQEKIKIFASKEVAAPKKPSWLVAGVAGIALSLGIFASSYMPMGAMMASLQNWINGDNGKPSVVVADNDNILKEFTKNNLNRSMITENIATNSENAPIVNSQPVEKGSTKPGNSTVASLNSEPIVVKERVLDKYSAKIKVDDMNDTLQELVKVADASEAKYSIQESSQGLTASAVGSGKIVSLQVPKDKVESVINNLTALGSGVPAKESTDFTKAYAVTEKALMELDQDINKLVSQDNLSNEQQSQLQKLKETQNDLIAEKQRLDQESNLVMFEVRLVEPINP